MPTIVIVRPGETEFDQEDRIQGQLDLPLTALGERQLLEEIERLRSLSINEVYGSPTEPARRCAQTIAVELDLTVKFLDGLTNMSLGLWEGSCVEEIRRKQPKVFRRWLDAPEYVCPPQGESLNEVTDRLRIALRKPLRKKGVIVLVCPEPLATLTGCLLRGQPLQIPVPGHQADGSRIVVIEPDSQVSSLATSNSMGA